MGRIGGLALILAACGGRSVSLDPFEVSGCPEGSGLRLLTYEPGTACDALDPTTDSTAPRTVPLDDALWSDREQEGPPRLRAPAESAVVEARCVDQDGVVDGWGCADERDGPLDLAVAPVCAPAGCAGCDWVCPAGALPRWTGTELCVAECAPAQEEPAGTEQDPGTGQDPSGQDPNDPGGNGDPVPDDQPNPDGTDPTACGACNGTTCCDGACVNTFEDEAHCGACGRACLGGDCSASFCLCPPDRPDACPLGDDLVCTDVATDPANCGVCGSACNVDQAAGGTCVGGVCQR